MYVLNNSKMQAADNTAIEKYGIPGIVLMENAALAVADEACKMLHKLNDTKVAVFCGSGNNGGDGFAVARILHNRGCNAAIIFVGSEEKLKEDSKANFIICENIGITILKSKDIEEIKNAGCETAGLVVDALFGTGLSGNLEDFYAELVDYINSLSVPMLSVDIPSGLSGDSNAIPGKAINATKTVTFAYPKIPHFIYPARKHCGDVIVADINIPKEIVESIIKPDLQVITGDVAAKLLPYRDRCGHKNTFGRVLVLAGSARYTGAAWLTAYSALVAGAGLVNLAIKEGVKIALPPEIIKIEYDNDLNAAKALLLNEAKQSKSIVIGPGWGVSEYNFELLNYLLSNLHNTGVKIILDADALNCLAEYNGVDLIENNDNIVITPHIGEMSRLTDLDNAEIIANLPDIVREYSSRWGVNVALKSASTIIGETGGNMYVNIYGNSGMGTAGSGDVLAGLIAGLAAQGGAVSGAAVLGVYLHSVAGDIAAEEVTEYSLTASDIIDSIHKAISTLYEERSGLCQ